MFLIISHPIHIFCVILLQANLITWQMKSYVLTCVCVYLAKSNLAFVLVRLIIGFYLVLNLSEYCDGNFL